VNIRVVGRPGTLHRRTPRDPPLRRSLLPGARHAELLLRHDRSAAGVHVPLLKERSSQRWVFASSSVKGAGRQPTRMSRRLPLTRCTLMRVEKPAMARSASRRPALSEVFVTHLLRCIVRYEADLVDQIFNSSEKRLAAPASPAVALHQGQQDRNRRRRRKSGTYSRRWSAPRGRASITS